MNPQFWDERYRADEYAYGREVEREIHEGAFHGGLSATVQLVAARR